MSEASIHHQRPRPPPKRPKPPVHRVLSTISEEAITIPPLILGAAGFSYQYTTTPHALPVTAIVSQAMELGLRAFDTSPYYAPSESLLGAALDSPAIASSYRRADYFLMTKCGRITQDDFDYTPSGIHKSVQSSLRKLRTDYLDVLFLHDVEFVLLDTALTALGVLFELKDVGVISYVGISGYPLTHLTLVCEACLARFRRPVDVVQSWAQLCLQNTRLKTSLSAFRKAHVRAVCNGSPLGVGMLRKQGPPLSSRGDWHPAPEELRRRICDAAGLVESAGEDLAELALRYSVQQAVRFSGRGMVLSTISGIGTEEELRANVASVTRTLVGEGNTRAPSGDKESEVRLGRVAVNAKQVEADELLYRQVRTVLGPWRDYDLRTLSQLLGDRWGAATLERPSEDDIDVTAGDEVNSIEI